MISFIKSNFTILAPIFLIFLTVDIFVLIFKLKNYSESIVNIKISYDIFKSYCFSFYPYSEYKLAIIYLTLENTSTSSIDITKIQLIDKSKSYLATFPKIKDDYNKNGISLIKDNDEIKCVIKNTLSENILNNTTLPPKGALKGYAVFENIEPISNSENYNIIIETPNKIFQEEITMNTCNDVLHSIKQLDE